jgi:hypothetical protein
MRMALDPHSFLVRTGALGVILTLGLVGSSCASGGSTGATSSAAPASYTGTVVNADSGVLTLQITAADKPGGVNGTMMRGRITDRTTLTGVSRSGSGSSGLPVTFVAAAAPNPDGTYDLISVTSQAR